MEKNKVKVNNFANVVKMLESTKDSRKAWYQNERTLARLLRKCQEKQMMSFTKPIFEACGLPTNGKLTQTKFMSFVKNFAEIKGEKFPAYVRKSPVYLRDAEGKCLKDKEGKYMQAVNEKNEPVFTYKLTAIKPGTWTLEKLIKAVTPAE